MFNPRRARFLRGGGPLPLRPPGAPAEADFVERCTRCGVCLERCPQNILVKGRAGFPEVDFSRVECTFCGGCAAHCAPGALQSWQGRLEAWTAKAEIGAACLTGRGVVCYSCQDVCDAAAIRFHPAAGKPPVVDTERCTGCGACVHVCPVDAIQVRALAERAP